MLSETNLRILVSPPYRVAYRPSSSSFDTINGGSAFCSRTTSTAKKDCSDLSSRSQEMAFKRKQANCLFRIPTAALPAGRASAARRRPTFDLAHRCCHGNTSNTAWYSIVQCSLLPNLCMSASAITPTSWRGDHRGHGGHFRHAAYDPAQSFAYTSACSGTRAASTLLTSAGSLGLGGPAVSHSGWAI